MSWECNIKKQHNNQHIEWFCKNMETGEEKSIETKIREEKVFPEEDFEYNGTINGKEISGQATTGYTPLRTIYADGNDKELTAAERAAGYAHIDVHHGRF